MLIAIATFVCYNISAFLRTIFTRFLLIPNTARGGPEREDLSAMKKLLFIVNPRAGKSKSHAPLFEAVHIFSDAEYLVRVRYTAGRGDATTFAV